MTQPLLEIKDICAGYGERDVLHDVSISVMGGEFTAVIGPNGHGKTTLMRAICGLIPARSGRVIFDGRDMAAMDPAARRVAGIAMVPQGDLLFPDMTIRENLLIGSNIEKSAARRADKIAKVFEIFPALASRQKQVAYTLSGGERRMLSIGRALAADSKLLIVDEPSLGLSPRLVDDVYAALTSLGEIGVTILLVEENVTRAQDFTEQLYLVDQGKVAWSGTAQDVDSAAGILSTYLGA
ncbi:ABC transporter ATP-binding protein [Pacificibacter marinus]|uniref:ABC transporter ATP-binding protein n=1 Tax=Pacificibacter marinus TaxID=658057 RepID=UPI001C070A22|nr:ABC transporter ATP-binding protein [Pacificibacter marinus]MBU2867428.1 ABC transporter ATP-binding protein [Pacificibacter marinus]